MKNSNQRIDTRHPLLLSRFLFETDGTPIPLPVTILFISPRVLWQRKSKRISRLSLVTWSHCGLDRSRSRILV